MSRCPEQLSKNIYKHSLFIKSRLNLQPANRLNLNKDPCFGTTSDHIVVPTLDCCFCQKSLIEKRTFKTSLKTAYAAKANCLFPTKEANNALVLSFAFIFDSKTTHFRIMFGLQFLKCHPVETIHPLVEMARTITILLFNKI